MYSKIFQLTRRNCGDAVGEDYPGFGYPLEEGAAALWVILYGPLKGGVHNV